MTRKYDIIRINKDGGISVHWNKCFNMIMEIKREYEERYKDGILNVEHWVERLNNEKYIDFLAPLQLNHYKEYVLVRYGLAEMQRGMWTDPESVYRHCRSTVIDLKNGELVLHPFTKFFNLNEVEETSLDNVINKLKTAKVIEIANKLDGSLFSARYYRGEIFTSTSMALDEENSWRLADAKRMLKESKEIQKLILKYPEYTFVFEYISLKDPHVVIYKEYDEGLYLIGITDMNTGRELNYAEIINLAREYGVKSTEIEDIKFEDLLVKSKEIRAHEKEGWVVNIDGHRFKIKGDDYVNIHRILDRISSVNVIIEALADDKYDDLISKIPFAYRGRVEKIADKIMDWKVEMETNIEKYFNEAPKGDKKEFMIWVNGIDKKYQHYVRCKYLGEEYNLLRNKNAGYRKAKDIFGMTADELMSEAST